MQWFDDIVLPLPALRRLAIVGALAVPLLAGAACPVAIDASQPIESQIDVLVAAIDDCGDSHRIGDDDALKAKALLIKLRADAAEVRRRHHGDLLDSDRTRFSTRLARILATEELVAK